MLSLMANSLDIVAIRVQDKRTVISRMVLRSNARSTIVLAASSESGFVKCIHSLTILGLKGDMEGRSDGLAGANPKIRLVALAEPRNRAKLPQHRITKRRERRDEKCLACLVVMNTERDVVEHETNLSTSSGNVVASWKPLPPPLRRPRTCFPAEILSQVERNFQDGT